MRPITLPAELYNYLREKTPVPSADYTTTRDVLAAATAATVQGETLYEVGVTPVTPYGMSHEMRCISLALSNLRYDIAEGRVSQAALRSRGITPEAIRQAHADAYESARACRA